MTEPDLPAVDALRRAAPVTAPQSAPSRSRGIKVTALDHQTGEAGEREIEPGDYCIIVADPLYLAGIQKHANGTIVLTLKRP